MSAACRGLMIWSNSIGTMPQTARSCPACDRRLQKSFSEQARSGIDIVNDGEFGKAMRSAIDFGAWWSYVYDRLAGFELREEEAKKGRGAWTFGSKERKEFCRVLRRGSERCRDGRARRHEHGARYTGSPAPLRSSIPVKPH